MSEATTVRIYADYVCPFCYLGHESLDRYRDDREAPLDVEWHPFDLRARKRGPDGELRDVDDGKDDAYFDQVRENVDRLRERYGAAEMLGIDDVPEVDSLSAQLVSLAVQREHADRWAAFDRAVYDALWVDGRDIGDRDVLVDVAGSVDVPAATVDDALADGELRETLTARFDASRSDGVTGVPTFVADGHAARGAVPPEQLERLVEGT